LETPAIYKTIFLFEVSLKKANTVKTIVNC